MRNDIYKMKCVNNSTYEDCLTIGKIYDVKIESEDDGDIMYHVIDDNGEKLRTLVKRFE
jgi:hypothetical protein